MFELNEKYKVDRRFLKCDFDRYSSSKKCKIITANSQTYISIPGEDSVTSLLNSYLDLSFEVFRKADNSRYSDGNEILLVNLGPIAFISNYKLTTSSGKQLEDFSHAHIVSLMYKIIASTKDSDDLSTGFDRDHGRR